VTAIWPSSLAGRVTDAEYYRRRDDSRQRQRFIRKPGKLNFLASNIDTTLGTQQLRAEFDNKPKTSCCPASSSVFAC
jgi:hypothetical protein